MSGVYCSTCGEMDYSAAGDVPCACSFMQEQQQASYDEQCAAEGHPYHGDEAERAVGRCYCGFERYPFGGPPEVAA